MPRRDSSFEWAIVEARSALNAGIYPPAEKPHEMLQTAAPQITRDMLGKTPRADVVAEGHVCNLTTQNRRSNGRPIPLDQPCSLLRRQP